MGPWAHDFSGFKDFVSLLFRRTIKRKGSQVRRVLFLGVLVSFSTFCNAKPAKTQDLVKEVSNLRTDLTKIQDRIDMVLQGVAPKTEIPEPIVHAPHEILRWINKISDYVKKRAETFMKGLLALADVFKTNVKDRIFYHLIALLISLMIAGLSLGVGTMIFRRKLLLLIKHKKPIHQLMLASISLLFASIPYFIISIFTSHFLDFLPWMIRPWSMTYGSFYPLSLYLVWAGFYWVHLVFHPSHALLKLEPIQSQECAFYLRLLISVYGLTALILGVLDVFEPNQESIYSLWDMVILIIIFLFSQVLSLVREGLIKTSDQITILKNLKFIKWFFFGFCLLWICANNLVGHLAVPLIATSAQFLLFAPLSYILRRWHLQFLWSKRHRFPFLRTLLMSQVWRSFPKYLSWGVIALIWLSVLKNDDPNFITTSSRWLYNILTLLVTGPILNVALIFFAANLLVKGGDRILKYYMIDKYATESFENNFLASRLKTLMAMLHTLLRILVWIPALSLILSEFEAFNLGTWVTSIGVASFGLTFGFQSIVRDFITGFFIILENNLMVGDEVEIDQRKGKVEAITIRTLKIRADNGTLLTIPFGSITVIGNKNRSFCAALLNISVGYNEDIEKVQSAIERAFAHMRKNPNIAKKILGPLEMRGLNEVTSYSMIFQVRIKTIPNNQDVVRRIFNRHLKQAFDEAGIVVPSPSYPILRADPSLTNTMLDFPR